MKNFKNTIFIFHVIVLPSIVIINFLTFCIMKTSHETKYEMNIKKFIMEWIGIPLYQE